MDPKLDLFRFMSNVNTTCFQYLQQHKFARKKIIFSEKNCFWFLTEIILICRGIFIFSCFEFVELFIKGLQLEKLIVEQNFLERIALQSVSCFKGRRAFKS